MTHRLYPFLVLSAALWMSLSVQAHTHLFGNSEGALKGYDPVAYFLDSKATPGVPEFHHDHEGVTWYFSSQDHLDRFVSEPGRYIPQYGGYCAYAMSNNQLAPVDPTAWTIFEGKLYLNYSKPVQATWLKDIPGYVLKADTHWTTQLAAIHKAAADKAASKKK